MSEEDAEYVCTLDETSQAKALRELNEDPRERMGAVRALREWVKQQPHIRSRTDTKFLLMFLRGAKFSQLKARKMLEGTLTQYTQIPEWFTNIDPTDDKIMRLVNAGSLIPLPKKTKDGCKILLIRPGVANPDWKDISINEDIKLNMIVGDEFEEDEVIQVSGVVFIMDVTGNTMRHATRWSLDAIRKWTNCWQGHFPGRYKAFHFYNMSPVLETLFNFMKSIMTSKFRNRIILHGQSLDGLYKHIPMELLPEEYLPDDYTGPHAGSTATIIANFRERISRPEFRKKMMTNFDGRYGIDEKLRPTDTGTEASFRKLNVD